MWHSIANISQPDTLEEALSQKERGEGTYLAGGSYLVAAAENHISDLIHIRPLLDRSLVKTDEYLRIGAGVSIQELIKHTTDDSTQLAEAAKYSCFSKNIRNQRTIGGEVVWNRGNSELNVYLHALDTSLKFISDDEHMVPICQVGGESGIVVSLEIEIGKIDHTILKRFAPLSSAPAFLILAAIRRQDSTTFSVGGKMTSPQVKSFAGYPEEKELTDFAQTIDLSADHYGSKAYKLNLLQDTLIESRDELWK